MGLWLALFVFSSVSFASNISEHESITGNAVDQFALCFPKKLSQYTRENLIFANVDEDVNLVRKWLVYSHFYSPNKDVSTWRGTSMNRVKDSENYLTAWKISLSEHSSFIGVQQAVSELGHIIHHIQDSAVPAHVVPIKHALNDHFENYRAKEVKLALSCADVVNAAPPSHHLYESALETVSSLRKSFAAKKDGQAIQLNWNYFWFDNGEKFGSYGYFGNSFGTQILRTKSGVYEVSNNVYEQYWLERKRQAVVQTAQALYWFFSNLLTGRQTRNVEMSDGTIVDLEELLFEN